MDKCYYAYGYYRNVIDDDHLVIISDMGINNIMRSYKITKRLHRGMDTAFTPIVRGDGIDQRATMSLVSDLPIVKIV